MKTERRHELQTNTLADHLGKWIVAIKPYTSIIVTVVVAVIVVAIGWQVMGSLSAGKRGKAWDDFEAARRQLLEASAAASVATSTGAEVDDAKLNAATRAVKVVIDDYEGQPVGYWARYLLGNHYQTLGTRKLFFDRKEARSDLKEAAIHYTEATAAEQEDLQQYAYFGLGQVLECQGEIEEAIKAYDDLVKSWPEGPLSASAREASQRLSKPETKEFYVHYETQDPKQARLEDEANNKGSGTGASLPKIPGLDGIVPPVDPLDKGPFIPKVVVPGEDSKDPEDTDSKPKNPTEESKLPKESAEDQPTDKKPEDKQPEGKKPAGEQPESKEPADDGPPNKETGEKEPADKPATGAGQ